MAQHSFRKSHSCLTNLLLTLDDWTQAVDSGTPIHACYLDMSKAFDRVNHSILKQKLKQYGVTGKLLAWLEDYLTDRVVRVSVDGALSRSVAATSGVPQGSVLGPILFLIYVNDIPKLVRCKIILFADDIKLWTSICDREDSALLQKDLDALHEWTL
ncbi:reverse transcriptase domain-containing protein, partial [Acinetobacter baumannii]|uniref:reverse transcriptase domain-containing protein n=1 Tax=Acinetobacter baumannii TaxID=470 RepID=UPI0033914B64